MRQSAIRYRQWLQSSTWKQLRALAIERDGKCVKCGSVKSLNVHHIEYPSNWNDTKLNQLQTLCRDCHRAEHGKIGSELFKAATVIDNQINSFNRPSAADWIAYQNLVRNEIDQDCFIDSIVKYFSVFARHLYPAWKRAQLSMLERNKH